MTQTPDEVRAFLMGDSAPASYPRPQSVYDANDAPVARPRLSQPRARAALLGWPLDADKSLGVPHAWKECVCKARKWEASNMPADGCECVCHGLTFAHVS